MTSIGETCFTIETTCNLKMSPRLLPRSLVVSISRNSIVNHVRALVTIHSPRLSPFLGGSVLLNWAGGGDGSVTYVPSRSFSSYLSSREGDDLSSFFRRLVLFLLDSLSLSRFPKKGISISGQWYCQKALILLGRWILLQHLLVTGRRTLHCLHTMFIL